MPTNREIIYTLKMRNQARQALQAFGSDFRSAAREALKAVRDINQAAQAVNALNGSAGTVATGFKTGMQAVAADARAMAAEVKRSMAEAKKAMAVGTGKPSAGGGAGPIIDTARIAAAAAAIRGIQDGRKGAGNTVSQSFSAARQSVVSFSTAIMTASAAIATFATANKVVQKADEYSQLISQLKIVSSSQNEVNAAFERLFAVAQRSRAPLNETIGLYTRLRRVSGDLGLTGNQLIEITETINQTVALSNVPLASAQAGLLQLSQGLASGTLRGEELNSVMEQVPRLAKAIADGMGVPVGQLRALAEQNKITAEEIVKAMQKQREAIQREFGQSAVTVSQAVVRIGNAFTKMIGEADQTAGATKRIAEALSNLANALTTQKVIEQVSGALRVFGTVMSGVVAGVTFLVQNLDLLGIGLATAGGAFVGIGVSVVVASGAFGTLGASIAAMATGGVASIQRVIAHLQFMTAVGTTSAAAMTVLSRVLAFAFGPIGLAAMAAGAAFYYFRGSATAASNASATLADQSRILREGYDETTKSVNKLTEAQKNSIIVANTAAKPKLLQEIKAAADNLTGMIMQFDAMGPGIFGNGMSAQLAPFKAAIEEFKKGAQEGAPNFQKLIDEVNRLAAANPALAETAKQITGWASSGTNAQQVLERLEATLAVVRGTATEAQRELVGLGGAFSKVIDSNPATALMGLTEAFKKMAEAIPGMKSVISAQTDLEGITKKHMEAVKFLGVAFGAGRISLDQYNERLDLLNKSFEAAKNGATGFTEAMRRLADANQDLRIEAMPENRAQAVARITAEYDRQRRAIEDNITSARGLAATADKEEDRVRILGQVRQLTQQLTELEKNRAQALENLSARAANDSANRIRDLRNELAASNATGFDRERLQYAQQRRIELEKTLTPLQAEAVLQRELAAWDQTRRQAAANQYRLGEQAELIRGMEAEARLSGLVGQAREREAFILERHNNLIRAGFTDQAQRTQMIQAEIAAYDRRNQALQQAQTFLNGTRNAMITYLEETRKVADESAKMWRGVFSAAEDSLVEFITKGKLDFQKFFASIAADFARFAVRQMLNNLFTGLSGGLNGNGGILSWLMGGTVAAAAGGGANTTAATAQAVAAAQTAAAAAASPVAAASQTLATTITNGAGLAGQAFQGVPGAIAQALKGMGATDMGIAGFLGNVQRESNFRWDAWNANDGGMPAYGLMQWRGDRLAALQAFTGQQRPDLQGQLAFMQQEFRTSESAALRQLQSASTLDEGVRAGIRYERPYQGSGGRVGHDAYDYDQRYASAQRFTGQNNPAAQQQLQVQQQQLQAAQGTRMSTEQLSQAQQQANGYLQSGQVLDQNQLATLQSLAANGKLDTQQLNQMVAQGQIQQSEATRLANINQQALATQQQQVAATQQAAANAQSGAQNAQVANMSVGNMTGANGQNPIASIGQQAAPQIQSSVGGAFQQVGTGVLGNFMGIFGSLGSGFQSIFSSVFSSLGNLFSSLFSGMGGGGGLFGSAGAGLLSGIAHTGGLIGQQTSARAVALAHFATADRFHTGGIIGNPLGQGEVPIIGKKNEAVLPTVRLPNGQFGVQAVMPGAGAAAPNAGGLSVTVNVTVNSSSSGDKDDDESMGQTIAEKVQAAVQAEIAKWTQNQMRPGGMLSKELRGY